MAKTKIMLPLVMASCLEATKQPQNYAIITVSDSRYGDFLLFVAVLVSF